MNEFCTYKTTYTGTLLPPHYIGSTTVAKVNAGYNGSVDSAIYKPIYIQEQKRNKSLFSTEILTLHDTREEAFDKELELHLQYNVVESEEYMNMALARSYPYFSNYGKPHSEDHKRKMSEAQIGKKRGPMSDEHNRKNSESKKGIPKSDEHRKNISAGKKGKPRPPSTEEARKNMSDGQKRRPPRSVETRRKISESKKENRDQKKLRKRYPTRSRIAK